MSKLSEILYTSYWFRPISNYRMIFLKRKYIKTTIKTFLARITLIYQGNVIYIIKFYWRDIREINDLRCQSFNVHVNNKLFKAWSRFCGVIFKHCFWNYDIWIEENTIGKKTQLLILYTQVVYRLRCRNNLLCVRFRFSVL
jgi:hypothetical protein